MTHWHIAHGLPSHGPDGSDGFITCEEITGWAGSLDTVLSEELERSADTVHDLFLSQVDLAEGCEGNGNTLGEVECYRAAIRAWKTSEHLATLARNFSPNRKEAPLYQLRPELWEPTVRGLLADNFPGGRITVTPNDSLYVWECPEGDSCEHLEDED